MCILHLHFKCKCHTCIFIQKLKSVLCKAFCSKSHCWTLTPWRHKRPVQLWGFFLSPTGCPAAYETRLRSNGKWGKLFSWREAVAVHSSSSAASLQGELFDGRSSWQYQTGSIEKLLFFFSVRFIQTGVGTAPTDTRGVGWGGAFQNYLCDHSSVKITVTRSYHKWQFSPFRVFRYSGRDRVTVR